jgi:mRNA interferase RelE/StbE
MGKLDLTRSAGRFLARLDAKPFRQVVSKILKLQENPEPYDAAQLVGNPPYRRVDIGEYWIVYRVEKDTVKIAVVGKRNDDEVYKAFQRKS